MALQTSPDRLLNPDGRRHYRRRYSLTEVRYSFLVLLGLCAIGAWIVYRGPLADPDLFGTPAALLDHDKPSSRGPVPPLGSPSFHEGTASSFNPDNLYEKIDGRADYFKALGFRKLYFLPLVSTADPNLTIDVEVYDLGTTQNALGAYSGERPKEAISRTSQSSIGHLSDNALFLARGSLYIRAIGSEAAPPIQQELARLYALLEDKLPATPLPWGYALFISTMGLPAGKVSFYKENAYSFAFASDIFAAAVGPDDTEIFAARTEGPGVAAGLAKQFTEGFLTYGEKTSGTAKTEPWITDRYLNQVSGATASGKWLLGVHSAPSAQAAAAALARLQAAVAAFDSQKTEDHHE